jgi:hypothetical protein
MGIKDKRMVEPLTVCLRNPYKHIQYDAGFALARLDEQVGVQKVIEILSENLPEPMDFELEVLPLLRELSAEYRQQILISLGYDPNKLY